MNKICDILRELIFFYPVNWQLIPIQYIFYLVELDKFFVFFLRSYTLKYNHKLFAKVVTYVTVL